MKDFSSTISAVKALPPQQMLAWAGAYDALRQAGIAPDQSAAAALSIAVARMGPTPSDVHVPVPGDGKRKPRKLTPASSEVDQTAKVYLVKVDAELRTVWGWASVIEEAGQPVVDLQGDVIQEADLVAAAHDFIGTRAIKAIHAGEEIGEMVESVVLTRSLQKALGIDLGLVGWLIAAKIDHEPSWQLAKDGGLPAFSIGGRGVRLDA